MQSLSFKKIFNRHIFLLLICIVFTIAAFWYLQERGLIKEYSDQQLEQNVTNLKRLAYDRTINLKSYVDHQRSRARETLENSLRNNVENLLQTIKRIYEDNEGRLSDEAIKQTIKNTIRSQRSSLNMGYYFANKMDGETVVHASQPELEGANLLFGDNEQGRHVIQGFIDVIKAEGKGFFEYQWYKPNDEGAHHKKLSYVAYFEPYDWFVGTGEYQQSVVSELQQQTLNWISKIRFDDEGYFFVHTYDGVNLSHIDQRVVGTNVNELVDADGVKFIQGLTNVGRSSSDGGEYTYTAHYNPETGKPAKKISYVISIPKWQWIIGTGIYLDSFNEITNASKAKMQDALETSFVKFGFLVLCLLVIGYLILRHLRIRLKNNFINFDHSLRSAIKYDDRMKQDDFNVAEFSELANNINEVLDENSKLVKTKKILEKRAIVSSKREALGTLAGGIAHDFNNMLHVLLSHVEALKLKIKNGQNIDEHIKALELSVFKAKEMLQKILMFSRSDETSPEAINVAEAIAEIVKFLEVSLPPNIQLDCDIDHDSGLILANETQMHRVMINLFQNSTQSIGREKGRIRFVVKKLKLDALPKHIRAIDNHRDNNVLISIQDSGPGIDEAIVDKIFDPYFSTKQKSLNTGMGLSVVLGIVNSYNGVVDVRNLTPSGVSIDMYFPSFSKT